jgi:hypothetical protein
MPKEKKPHLAALELLRNKGAEAEAARNWART